jgi:uncharacterized protein
MASLKLQWFHFLGVALLGAFTGMASGLFGVGGGIVLVPGLVLLFGMTQQSAQGISLATMVPLALVNAFTYFRQGAFKLDAASIYFMLAIMVGSLLAGPKGSVIANHLPQNTLKALFALFLVAVAVKIMPQSNVRSMGLLLGVLLVAIGIRLIFAK